MEPGNHTENPNRKRPFSDQADRHGLDVPQTGLGLTREQRRLGRAEAWQAFLRLLRYLRPYRGRVIAAVLSLLAMAGLDVLRPVVIMLVIDRVIVDGEVELLLPLIGLIAVISLALAGATFALTVLRRSIGEHVVRDLRAELYAHLHHLDLRFHEDTPTGELISRTSTDVQAVRRFMGHGLLSSLRIVITTVVVLVAGIIINLPMTALIAVTGPAMYLTVRSFGRQAKPAFAAVHEQNASLSEALSENITGIRVVRSYGQEDAESERFDLENRVALDRQLRVASIRAKHAPVMDFWVLLSRAIVLLGGGLIVIGGGATIGALVAFDGFLSRLMGPIREAHGLIDLAGESMSAADRIFDLLDRQSNVTDPTEPVRPEEPPSIELDDLHLIRGGEEVLRGISLQVRPRETVALVGTTGAGKSSLVHMINRSHDPSSGAIRLAGHDLREFDLADLRSRVTVVHQESHLFSTTVYENIAYGRPNATPDEVEDAARRAYAHDFIVKLPAGYDTIIGERGAGLSGGQRQRIAIARALVMRPDVLLIDDATSALDTETEAGIWSGLGDVVGDATTIIVAQRLSTLRGVDRIGVMENGRIVELGSHDELMELDGRYAEMYELQTASLLGDDHAEPADAVRRCG